MRRAKAEVYLHFVWATQGRQPWLTPERTPPVYRCIVGVAERLGCVVLAVGGMPDHVHPAVRLPPRLAVAQLAQQVKGASSKLAGDLDRRERFRWQEGYGVFSLSRPHLSKVIAYIESQPRHHSAGGRPWPDLEGTGEEV
jgi:REP element-mobilizing transposase RayT